MQDKQAGVGSNLGCGPEVARKTKGLSTSNILSVIVCRTTPTSSPRSFLILLAISCTSFGKTLAYGFVLQQRILSGSVNANAGPSSFVVRHLLRPPGRFWFSLPSLWENARIRRCFAAKKCCRALFTPTLVRHRLSYDTYFVLEGEGPLGEGADLIEMKTFLLQRGVAPLESDRIVEAFASFSTVGERLMTWEQREATLLEKKRQLVDGPRNAASKDEQSSTDQGQSSKAVTGTVQTAVAVPEPNVAGVSLVERPLNDTTSAKGYVVSISGTPNAQGPFCRPLPPTAWPRLPGLQVLRGRVACRCYV